MILIGTSSMMVGNVVLAYATHPGVAALAFVLIGVNFGIVWPAFNAMIASVVDGELRQRYFGVNFALVNLGIGLGGVIGGFFVDVSRPETFTVIFLADAASMLVPIGLLLGPLRHVHGRAEQPDEVDVDVPTTYGAILRQPSVLLADAVDVPRDVRRLRPARGGLPGVLPRGRRGLDAHRSASRSRSTRR